MFTKEKKDHVRKIHFMTVHLGKISNLHDASPVSHWNIGFQELPENSGSENAILIYTFDESLDKSKAIINAS